VLGVLDALLRLLKEKEVLARARALKKTIENSTVAAPSLPAPGEKNAGKKKEEEEEEMEDIDDLDAEVGKEEM